MTTTDQTKLAAIRRLLQRVIDEGERATPGPWEASRVDDVGGASIYGNMKASENRDRRVIASGQYDTQGDENLRPNICTPLYSEECDANTTFIATARTYSPLMAKAWLHVMDICERDLNNDSAGYLLEGRKRLAHELLLSIIATFPEETL